MPAMPSCTVDGAFGIARTTGTPSAMRASIVRGRDRRRDREHGLLGESSEPMSLEQRVDVLRLHRDDDERRRRAPRRAFDGRRLDAVPLAQLGDALLAARLVTTMSRQPELSSPESSASPMRPPPMIAIVAACAEATRRAAVTGTSPRAKPASRYTLASPAHSPYGSSSSAVSQPSTGRPRSARRA